MSNQIRNSINTINSSINTSINNEIQFIEDTPEDTPEDTSEDTPNISLNHSFHNQFNIVNSFSNYDNNFLHSHSDFGESIVYQLNCHYCHNILSKRGMKCILLGNSQIEIYSTDIISQNMVQLVEYDHKAKNCLCQIRDMACLECGNVIGYHVVRPCKECMRANNNGHFWMFNEDSIEASEIVDSKDKKWLIWNNLSIEDKNCNINDEAYFCR